MKQQLILSVVGGLLLLLICPSSALAAWWNPLTWHWNPSGIFDIFSESPGNGQDGSLPTSPTPVTDTPQAAPQPNDSQEAFSVPAGWTIYRNTNYDYQVAYPNNLPPSSELHSGNILSQVSFGSGGLDLSIRIIPSSMSPEDAVKYQASALQNGAGGYQTTYQTSDIIVAGIRGKQIAINYVNQDGTPSHALVETYINRGTEQVVFGCFYEATPPSLQQTEPYPKARGAGAEFDGGCAILGQMISTFSFTNDSP
jgi:hypothetical protein